MAIAGLTLPAGVGARDDEDRAEGRRSRAGAGAPAVELPLGYPWEAAVVEPPLEEPAPAAPWEAAAVEPDGMPLPAAPATTPPGASAPPAASRPGPATPATSSSGPATPAAPRPTSATPATSAPKTVSARAQALAPAPAAPKAAPGERARGGVVTEPSSEELVPPEREYLRKTLVRYAQENGLPADLVMALAWKESSWRARVVSEAGAIGVMQLMPKTVEFTSRNLMGLKGNLNPRDPVANIRMGTRFLRHLVDRSGADYRQALIAYNQGLTSLKSRGSYSGSEGFAAAVLALRSRFRRP